MSTQLNVPAELPTGALSAGFQIEHGGQAAMLVMTLVRSIWKTEGHAITELLFADGSHFYAHGVFRIARGDEGPTTLVVEVDMPDDLNESPEAKKLSDRLLADLVHVGSSWGLEAWEPCS